MAGRLTRIVFSEKAESDLRGARRWYREQVVGLDRAFGRAVDATLDHIRSNPRLYTEAHQGVRRAPLRSFPYLVYYRLEPERVVVLALAHQKQHPDRWREET